MLIVRADIKFNRPEGNTVESDGISTQYPLRPAFKFGDGLLFSGTIISNIPCDKFLYQESYHVNIEFPTIEGEAYEEIKPLINEGMILDIQNASRIIGTAKVLDFTYKK
ncbi:hypothetical protein Q428_14765 [Fervidicella metallireducens AeB]|uniref:Translation elongation factor EFTu/EF1A C-terminal domain-containing protein n=1 Tax=Fervidicella metallireducens AeB TaxID=1403537 RepID=A0A017RRG5_9CLOT|nr:hypothetical protein [Fervidicella metallireducens]EYE87181.1 hypothetical protein Q428_14765 [Fervidicella metallireducens AeB]